MKVAGSVLLLMGLMALISAGADPVIESFTLDGQLAWTNAKPGGAYSIQWTSSITQDNWRSDWRELSPVAATGTTMTVGVPMFYRVREIPDMVVIPGGPFAMGYPYISVRTVTVSAFTMDINEITKARWDEVRNWGLTNGYTDLAVGQAGTGGVTATDHPVTTVSWYHMLKWCNARSEMAGLTPCYYTNASLLTDAVYRTGAQIISNSWVNWTSGGYRLPTDAEWEKAARSGLDSKLYPWGDDSPDATRANYNNNVGATTPVGSYPTNAYGLYDMAGNVVDLCWDLYTVAYAPPEGAVDPRGPVTNEYSSTTRLGHGGNWGDTASFLRCSDRSYYIPYDSNGNYFGFRCVRNP